MTYRKFLHAGAATAAIGLLAGGALAQIGQQQQRQQQPRLGQVTPINGEEFLQQLEGSWNVEVTIYDMEVLEGRHLRRPGEPRPGIDPGALPQIRTQIEQAFVRAGVSQAEARMHAQRLSQRIQQERPMQAQMQTMIQQALTQAGVAQAQARTEAQRLAQNLQQFVRPDGERLRPEDDPTADPIRPDRPRETPEPRVDPAREAQFRGKGTANRSWTLNETFLQEELTFTVEVEPGAEPRRPLQPQPRQLRIDLRNGDEYEGLGLFAFEGATGDLCMVWADNAKSMLHYSIGQYDTAQQAMVLYTIDPDRITLPHMPMRPGITPTPRPAPGGPHDQAPGERRPGVQERPGVDRPGAAQERLRLQPEGSRILLRVIDNNEHVMHVYYSDGFGRSTRVMDLTYTRNN